MFRFDNYCEEWAKKFRPISHDPNIGSKEKRFYRMNYYQELNTLCTNLNMAKSPAMAVATQIEAETEGKTSKFLRHSLKVYFLVRQESSAIAVGAASELNAAAAKAEGYELAEKFLAYISADKNGIKDDQGNLLSPANPDLHGLVLDRAEIFTAPSIYGNWWVTALIIENITQRQLCVNREEYDF